MRIGVVIPTYNRKTHLLNLLEDLNAQGLPSDVDLKIITVVDGSTDGTIEAIRALPSPPVVVEGPGTWWFTKSLNIGCQKAEALNCDYILTLNDDCRIPPGLVRILVAAESSMSRPGCVCAITLIRSHPYRVTFSGAPAFVKWRARFKPYLANRVEVQPASLKGVYPSKSVMTRGLLFPVKVGASIGYFDQVRFPQYGSDEDFGLRLLKAGHKVNVCWDAQILDDPKLTSTGSAVNRPTLRDLVRSFFNAYSVNSLQKTARFYTRHGYWPLLPLHLLVYIAGTFYASLWKYRHTE